MTRLLHVHLDPVGGIAGDMFVAAMLAARPDLEGRVLADVAAVLPAGTGEARLADVLSGGIAARHFSLAPVEPAPPAEESHRFGDDHHHDHGHHHHHRDGHERRGGQGHGHRHGDASAAATAHIDHHPAHHHHAHGSGTFAGMRETIRTAGLSMGTAEAAIAILTILAEAEARMHRMPVEEVHFHEIGDWDSLMDVVAAGSIAAALDGASWSVAPLPLGGGLVRTAHGLLPVPAPATAEILTGFAWRDDGIGGERVTPTGAAILRFLVGGSGRPTQADLLGVGYGAGTRILPGMPNVLRASLFEPAGTNQQIEVLLELAFDIDDMTGEEIAEAADRLRARPGVRDLRLVPGMGKKGRPLTTFALLVEPEHRAAVGREAFLQSSTLGLRWHEIRREILPREEGLSAQGLRFKQAQRPDGTSTVKIESDALGAACTLAERRLLAQRGRE